MSPCHAIVFKVLHMLASVSGNCEFGPPGHSLPPVPSPDSIRFYTFLPVFIRFDLVFEPLLPIYTCLHPFVPFFKPIFISFYLLSTVTYDMLHVTCDMRHMTHDRLGEENFLSKFQLPSSYGLRVKVY